MLVLVENYLTTDECPAYFYMYPDQFGLNYAHYMQVVGCNLDLCVWSHLPLCELPILLDRDTCVLAMWGSDGQHVINGKDFESRRVVFLGGHEY